MLRICSLCRRRPSVAADGWMRRRTWSNWNTNPFHIPLNNFNPLNATKHCAHYGKKHYHHLQHHLQRSFHFNSTCSTNKIKDVINLLWYARLVMCVPIYTNMKMLIITCISSYYVQILESSFFFLINFLFSIW